MIRDRKFDSHKHITVRDMYGAQNKSFTLKKKKCRWDPYIADISLINLVWSMVAAIMMGGVCLCGYLVV